MNSAWRKAIVAAALALIPGAIAVGLAAGELVPGGGFEDGVFPAGWVHGAAGTPGGGTNPDWADHVVVTDLPYAGRYSALLGFKYTPQRPNRYGFMYADVAIPTNISRATFSFRFRQQGYDGLNYDPFWMVIRRTDGSPLAMVVNYSFSERGDGFKDSGWIEVGGAQGGHDMTAYAGQTVRLDFRQHNLQDNSYRTWVFIDDVSLVYRRFVDLAVDGNGDDLFGARGTGAGGQAIASCAAGGTAVYRLEIENEGLDDDSYDISAAGGMVAWNVTIIHGGLEHPLPWTTPVIAAGDRIEVEVSIATAPGAPLGGYETIIDAVSTAHDNRFDSVRLCTNIVAGSFLADLAVDGDGFGLIDPDGAGGFSLREAAVDTALEYALALRNAGEQPDEFDVWFRPDAPLAAVIIDGAVERAGLFTTGALAPGDSLSLKLRVTVPPSLTGGDYTTFVHARSRGDTLRRDCVSAVTRVLAPRIDMIIGGDGDGIYDATGSGGGGSCVIAGLRNGVVEFPVSVQNEGGVRDSFTLDWTPPGGGWSAVINDGVSSHAFPWTTPAFDPYGRCSYTLIVSIPGNPGSAAYKTHVSILHAESRVDPAVRESVTAAVTVTAGNEVDLIIDGNGADVYGALGSGLGGSSSVEAAPGDTVAFEIVVENESGADAFDLQWAAPDGWIVLLDGEPSPLAGRPAGAYLLRAVIPPGCPAGEHGIVFDAWKADKPYFVDSVKGRVFVTPERRVDALIDGDGGGLFGTPGLGDGGSALRGTIAGRAVAFTVELRNLGPEAEAYSVDWNALAGWSAALDAQDCPCTTASIAAGGSGFFAFEVAPPTEAAPGDYDYVIDVVSTSDPENVESVTASIRIYPPSEIDLVIEGRGAFATAPAGSGEGGRAIVFGSPGSTVEAELLVVNRGGCVDSFRVSWNEPAAWPVGSVVLSDGARDFASPLVTPLLEPGAAAAYTVRASVPETAALRNALVIDGRALSSPFEDSVLLELLTGAFVTGRVFEDADHDGVAGPGEAGIPGVTVTLSDPAGTLVAVTGAGGAYLFEVAAEVARELIRMPLSGTIALSPDTVAVAPPAAGDTVVVDFAVAYLSTIAPSHVASAPAGVFADLPHTITAGTAGQAALAIELPDGWAAAAYCDCNGDGLLDGGDRPLQPDDLDLDPAVAGRDVVRVIVRVFIPATEAPATVGVCAFTLEQTLAGTTLVTASRVENSVTVLAAASGNLDLVKTADPPQARPGEVITYTIVFSNPGVEEVREIEIVDPVSGAVDLVTDAFGPGRDIALTTAAGTVYLTADPFDEDEALYDADTGTLRVVLSRRAPFVLESGAEGSIEYQVRIR